MQRSIAGYSARTRLQLPHADKIPQNLHHRGQVNPIQKYGSSDVAAAVEADAKCEHLSIDLTDPSLLQDAQKLLSDPYRRLIEHQEKIMS